MKLFNCKTLIYLIINLLNISINAQNFQFPSTYCNPLQQPPNIAALGKFGDIPVGKYSGIPEISIPLYTIKVKNFELPISISYHASGIKVSEEASYIGLGWALNAGGMISQSVNGSNDIAYKNLGQMGYKSHDLPDAGTSGSQYGIYTGCNNFVTETSVEVLYQPTDLTYNCVKGSPGNEFMSGYDLEPDIFYYNFGSYSGKFIWDKLTNSFQTLDRTKINIKYIEALIGINITAIGWELKTPDGYIYKFNAKEYNEACSGSIGAQPSGTMGPFWDNFYLSVIILPSLDSIQFKYFKGDRVCNLPNYGENYVDDPEIGFGPSDYGLNRFLSQTSYFPEYLDSIILPSSYLKFTWDSRIDIINGLRLVNIKAYNTDNKIIKEIDFFNNNYFQGIQSNENNFGFLACMPGDNSCDKASINSDITLKRLKLDSIQISGQENPYMFFYDKCSLPSKRSFSKDYWGFYNGNIGATSLIPDLLKYDLSTGVTPPTIFSDKVTPQDRRATDSTKACILNKIIYPTKGYTQFQFELNSFSNYLIPNQKGLAYKNLSYGGGLRINSITDYDGSGKYIKKTYKYEYQKQINGQICNFSYGKVMDLSSFCRSFKIYDWDNDPFWGCKLFMNIYGNKRILYGDPANGFSTTTQGNYVGYDKVIEIYGDETNNIGTIEYSFMNNGFSSNHASIAPGRPMPGNGLQTFGCYKDVDGNVLKTETFGYGGPPDDLSAYGIKSESIGYGCANASYNLHEYAVEGSRINLTSKITNTSDIKNKLSIIDTTTYEYNTNGLVKSESFTNSDGSILKKSYKYPQDFNNDPYTTMVNQLNWINPVIEQNNDVLRNGTIINAYHQTNTYENSSNGGSSPMSTKLIEVKNSFGTGSLESVFHVLRYDNNNNPISTIDRSGVITSYVMGYNNLYPIAKAINSNYDQIAYTSFEAYNEGNWSYLSGALVTSNTAKTGRKYFSMSGSNCINTYLNSGKYRIEFWARSAVSVGGGIVTNISSSQPDANGWILTIKEIELTSNGTVYLSGTTDIDELKLYPVDAQMTTYTYDPLIGMTSSTDPNGITTYYIYDTFGRLTDIKDKDGNVLKHYEYNYAH